MRVEKFAVRVGGAACGAIVLGHRVKRIDVIAPHPLARLRFTDCVIPADRLIGAEGDGMRQLTRKTCDALVSLPMRGAVESLNVSVASGVCLYEALRQRSL